MINFINLFNLDVLSNKGVIDVIVVKQSDGSFKSSRIHLNFGISNTKSFPLEIKVNNETIYGHGIILISKETSYKIKSEDINRMNLVQGRNSVEYSIQPDYSKRIILYSFIYFWNFNDKIVVSDIDGTITKSDFFGFLLKNKWCQSGVVKLFNKIENNLYKLIYLSARPRGLNTRQFLKEINQFEKRLPDGPILLNPSNIFKSFCQHATKRSDKLKTLCLNEIIELFPANPIIAGFGNQSSDREAYKNCFVPHIFLISSKGELSFNNHRKSTYDSLADDKIFDELFPPLH